MAAAQLRTVRQGRRWPLWLLLLGAMLAAGWGLWSLHQPPLQSAPQATGLQGMSTWMKAGVGEGSVTVPAFKSGLENLPNSLRGTEVPDGEFEDAKGHLVLSRGLRDLFDYFLSSRGEQADAILDARIRAYLRHRLSPTAATEALTLLDAYLVYLQKVDGLLQTGQGAHPMEPSERLVLLQRLRRESMTPQAVVAFFEQDEAYDQYTVDKVAVMADTSLNPVQKSARLKALRQALPESLRDGLDATEVAQSLNAVTDEWRQRSGSVAELRTLRENIVGVQAANRLEDLDRENEQWQARVQAYLKARSDVLADTSLSQDMKQAKIAGLLQSSFSATEQLRAQSYERMSDAHTLAATGS